MTLSARSILPKRGSIAGISVLAAAVSVVWGCSLSLPASPQAALTGVVRSAEEGVMEGVVVSAKQRGSTITVSVVSGADGRYSFPADRLIPGRYTLTARATGFDLSSLGAVDLVAGREASAHLNLVPTADLPAQLTNAEWMMSAPGSAEDKSALLSCNECHSLQRPIGSVHSAEEFVGVIQRMATYSFNSSFDDPQMLAHPRLPGPERYQGLARYLASINLSGGRKTWTFPLKTLPRIRGRGTRVIITEYDLPRPLTQPHDVIVDADGAAWYTDFGKQFIGRLDPKTGKVREYPVPLMRRDSPVGSLAIEFGGDGALWVAMLYQGAIGRFDPRTEKWRVYTLPKELQRPELRLSHIAPSRSAGGFMVWTVGPYGAMKLDPRTGAFEIVNPFNGSPPTLHSFALITGSPIPGGARAGSVDWSEYYSARLGKAGAKGAGPTPPLAEVPVLYGLTSDRRNNLYGLDFGGDRVVRIDAATGRITNFRTAVFASRPRRGRTDATNRLWFAQYNADRIGMLDTRTGRMREWRVPTPHTNPYDAVGDRNGFAWTAGMDTDRVVRLNLANGEFTEFPLPRSTNVRRVFVDDRTPKSVFWVGNNHAASIVKVEPLD